jgi:hypothetical protein
MKGSSIYLLDLIDAIFYFEESKPRCGPIGQLAEEILHTTDWNKDPEVVAKEIIARGVDPNEETYDMISIFTHATDTHGPASDYAIRVLLAAGSEPDIYTVTQLVEQHRDEMAVLLLNNGAPFDTPGDEPILAIAIEHASSLPVFEALEKCGVFQQPLPDDLLSTAFPDERTCPKDGCFCPQLRFLVDHGANPLVIVPGDGMNLLHYATAAECVHSIEYLVNWLDINSVDNNGDTPIFGAYRTPTVECCVRLGANINHMNHEGLTCLAQRIMIRAHHDAVLAVLKSGADPNICSNAKNHPFSVFVDAFRCEKDSKHRMLYASLLIKYGASPLLACRLGGMAECIVISHMRTTLARCFAEVSRESEDPRIVAKIDMDSNFGDVALPMSLPYHRLPEWIAALREIVPNAFTTIKYEPSLRRLAKAIEATPAAVRMKEEMAERDCANYETKKRKKSEEKE